MKVFKVVSNWGNGLWSARAAYPFLKTYQNQMGESLIVDEALAFDSLENAQLFCGMHPGMADEIWEAECETAKPIEKIFRKAWEIPTTITCYKDIDWTKCTVTEAPQGSLLCTNLQLVEFVETAYREEF